MHPIRISANRRYFVDPTGNPVFWLGTTQWQLFREFTLDEARLIIEKSKATGFDFIQVMLLGVGDGTQPNIHGEKPCHDDDSSVPNEAYFQNVDAVMEIARRNDVAISMTVFHQRYRKFITPEKARDWALLDGKQGMVRSSIGLDRLIFSETQKRRKPLSTYYFG